MYSSIQQKYGDCSLCPSKDVPVVKIGKETICVYCNKKNKAKKSLQKQTERNKLRSLQYTEQNKSVKTESELSVWFKVRHGEMTGKCKHCNGKTQKDADNFINSICHILSKEYFPSVAINEYNWIELCFYDNSCHSQMDNKMLDLIDMNCFDEIVEKFVKIYPSIAKNERRRIPAILMQYIETEK